MAVEFFLKKIAKEFPDFRWKTYESITYGWDHLVIIFDKNIVFRIPKNLKYKKEFKNEIRLLCYFKNKFQLNIPDYIYISRDKTMAGYSIIEGELLTPFIYRHLTIREKERVVEQLAEFITTLHKTPKFVINKYHINIEDRSKYYRELVRDCNRYIFPRLPERYIKLIKEYFQKLKDSFSHDYRNTFIHNDLKSEHILWDNKKKQINIIDFSDRAFGDPALDFAELFEFGPEFVKKVFDLYSGKKDELMLYRALRI